MTGPDDIQNSTDSDVHVGDGPFPADAWKLLSPMLTDQRRTKLEQLARERTRHVRLVMQDTHHPHNVSACLRSAEAFGVADVDLVCHREKFKPSTVARGVAGWLRLWRHDSIADAARALKHAGFCIAAGVPPGPHAASLDELPLDRPVALVFGNEKLGVDSEWNQFLDVRFTIPMCGMVESLNISVSAAIAMQALTSRGRREIPRDQYFFDEAGKNRLLNTWICRQVRSWEKQLEILRQRQT